MPRGWTEANGQPRHLQKNRSPAEAGKRFCLRSIRIGARPLLAVASAASRAPTMTTTSMAPTTAVLAAKATTAVAKALATRAPTPAMATRPTVATAVTMATTRAASPARAALAAEAAATAAKRLATAVAVALVAATTPVEQTGLGLTRRADQRQTQHRHEDGHTNQNNSIHLCDTSTKETQPTAGRSTALATGPTSLLTETPVASCTKPHPQWPPKSPAIPRATLPRPGSPSPSPSTDRQNR